MAEPVAGGMSAVTADVDVAVGRRIADARREVGLTQADLAAKIGVSLRAIDRYESGVVEPTPEVLELVAKATGVSMSGLTDTDAKPAHVVERISDAVRDTDSISDRGEDAEADTGETYVLRRTDQLDVDEGGAMSDTRPATTRSAAQASQSALPAPPLDIRHEDLPRKTLGYSPKATAQLFDQVADAYTRLWEDRAVLKRKVEELEVELIGQPEPSPGAVSAAEAKFEQADASRQQLALQLEQSASALAAARQEVSRLTHHVAELERELQSSGERGEASDERAAEAEAALEHYREQERLIGEILVSARRSSTEIEESAKEEADRIRRDAQREASKLLSESEREVERLASERQRLEALASEVQEDLSSFLLGALERVNGRDATPQPESTSEQTVPATDAPSDTSPSAPSAATTDV